MSSQSPSECEAADSKQDDRGGLGDGGDRQGAAGEGGDGFVGEELVGVGVAELEADDLEGVAEVGGECVAVQV